MNSELISLIQSGHATLLLGAGFSLENSNATGKIPLANGLRKVFIDKLGFPNDTSDELNDLYEFSNGKIDRIQIFKDLFHATNIFEWQKWIFRVHWDSIFTTNIDDILQTAHKSEEISGKLAADFKFFNFMDSFPIERLKTYIPVAFLHGLIDEDDKGFIFSDIEYSQVAAKRNDWTVQMGEKIAAGGCVIIGSKFKESDIQLYIENSKIRGAVQCRPNFIIAKGLGPVRTSNLEQRGFIIIDETAESVISEIMRVIPSLSTLDVMGESPIIRTSMQERAARTWFISQFSTVTDRVNSKQSNSGIRDFLYTGDQPKWYYIKHQAYAATRYIAEIEEKIRSQIKINGISAIAIHGASGSGKTISIRAALYSLLSEYPAQYEMHENGSVDTTLLDVIIKSIKTPSVFVIYDAHEYAY